MSIKSWLLIVLLVCIASQSIAGEVVLEDAFEMGGGSSLQVSDQLFVEPKTVQKERDDFVKRVRFTGRNRRPLYEEYLNVIGANGILDGIQRVWPKCHSEAHDLGKVILARVRNIGESLRICADRCSSACMHGVLMEAFTESQERASRGGHVYLSTVRRLMNDVCYKNTEMIASYSPGDCAHGVGHALMYLTGYNIPKAMRACAGFRDPAMKYYCATGAYMEYVTERDSEDAKSKSLLYPCDTYDYPAACSRYKMARVGRRHYLARKKTGELISECKKLSGKFRLGCFHGLGNAHMGPIARGRISIKEVCLHGTEDDRFMCIEGAMERMAKYHEKRALVVCEQLEGKNKEACLTAVEHKMYYMKKDFTLYVAE